jgi:hypothetical protein
LKIPEIQNTVGLGVVNVPSPQMPRAVPGAFGGGIAQATENIGKVEEGIANQMAERQKERYQLDQDQLETQLYLQSDAYKQNLLLNNENEDVIVNGQKVTRPKGILNRQLSQADGSTNDFRSNYEKYNSELLNSVQDPVTKTKLSKRFAVDTLNTQEQVIKHETTQWNKNKENIFNTGIEVAKNNAANSRTPQDLMVQMINAGFNQESLNKLNSVDPDTAALNIKKSNDAVVSASVFGQIAVDKTGDTSRALLEFSKDKITKETYNDLSKKIDSQMKVISKETEDGLYSAFINNTLNIQDIQAASVPVEKGGIGAKAAITLQNKLIKAQDVEIKDITASNEDAKSYVDLVSALISDKVDSFSAKQILVDAVSDGIIDKNETKKLGDIRKNLEAQKWNANSDWFIKPIKWIQSFHKDNNTSDVELAISLRKMLAADDKKEDVWKSANNIVMDARVKINPALSTLPESGQIMVDKYGNKAKVYPDGRIEETK